MTEAAALITAANPHAQKRHATKRVVVAMSGGVDSSVTAYLLRESGHDVVGLFLRHGEQAQASPLALAPSHRQGCCSLDDSRDAAAVASALGIPFYVLDYASEFGAIVDSFVHAYRSGRTPNPCVVCNRDIKFGSLVKFAKHLDAESVATGHYARIEDLDGRRRLRRAADVKKDQSYVLAAMEPDSLRDARFPLGSLVKADVRDIARRAGLPVAEKRESQEICFVPSNDYRDLLHSRGVDGTPGKVVDADGGVLGEHSGYEHFTIGQRRGIGIAASQALYVTDVDPLTATVTVGPRPELQVAALESDSATWFVEPPAHSAAYAVQFRAHHEPVKARVACQGSGVRVEFEAPVHAVAPGQLAVFYDESDCVAGACWIDRTVKSAR